MDEREHRRVRSDPKRQREHGDGCKPSMLSERPERIAPVLGKCFEQRQTALSSILLFHLLQPTEIASGRAASLVEGHATVNVVFRKGVKMRLNLLRELGISSPLRENRDDP
jgi:hypothetical protein